MTKITKDKRQESAAMVSVVMPVLNGAATIGRALDSVLVQDVPFEIIIVDDGSSDGLEAVLAPYLAMPQIRFIKNSRRLGASESRNKGVRAARGRYIAFLDCDDWWEKGKLARQLKLMKNTGCVLCATGRRLVTEDGRQTERLIGVQPQLTYKDLLFQNPVNCSSVVLLRSVALEFPMGHDECHEDYIMWLQILRKYKKACAINEPLLNYRLSSKGKSGNKLHSAVMTYRVYRHMGFSTLKSLICFAGYAFNGVRKYYLHRS